MFIKIDFDMVSNERRIGVWREWDAYQRLVFVSEMSGSVIIWFRIMYGRNCFSTYSITMKRQIYIVIIIRYTVQPIQEEMDLNFVFIEDNVCLHWTQAVRDVFREGEIERIEGSPFSPDMNTIELTYDYLSRLIRHCFRPFTDCS